MIQPSAKSGNQPKSFSQTPLVTPTHPGHSVLPPSPSCVTVTTHDDIAQRAYDIYVQNGYRQGQCNKNWLQAEKDLRQQGPVACEAEHRAKEVFAPDSIDSR